jgi:hypothetical protein
VSTTVPNSATSTSTTETEERFDRPGLTAWPYKDETEPLYVGADVPDMITCQPWCAYGPDHGRDPLEDQWCHGAERRVALHLRETVECSDNSWEHQYITVHPAKTFGHDTTIFMGVNEASGVDMTLGEASAVAHEILRAVDLAKGSHQLGFERGYQDAQAATA